VAVTLLSYMSMSIMSMITSRPLIALVLCAGSLQAQASSAVKITLRSGTPAEKLAKAQLERIIAAFPIDRWLLTRDIFIDEDVIPHSHPVLTLNAHQLENDTVQVGNLLHEEFHWLEEARPDPREAAIAAFRELYPDAPAAGPAGARDKSSTYLHLIVCDMEFQALAILVGELAARRILAAKPYYTWIYNRVLRDPAVRATNIRFGFVVS
jgi:hypothetical protein